MFWKKENLQIFVLLGKKHERDYDELKHCKITFENSNSLQAWKFERFNEAENCKLFPWGSSCKLNAVWFTQL